MITTRISVKPHLAEYFTRKYWDEETQCCHLRDQTPVRWKILAALRRRPADVPVDRGNFLLVVPSSKIIHKDPRTHNYIPECKVRGGPRHPGIERMMEDEFYTDFADFWETYRHNGLQFQDCVEDFIDVHELTVEPATVAKHYTRWRDRWRHYKKTRKYEQQRGNVRQTLTKRTK